MSKKNKRRQRKNSSLLTLILGGGILLIAAAFFLFTQGEGGGAPSIAVNQQVIDYGDVRFNTEKAFAIKVTNTGDGTLRFKEQPYVEVVEGC